MTQAIGAVMVAGGGVAGIRAALDLADSGFFVYAIEKTPGIGGAMAQLDKTFPPPTDPCVFSPLIRSPEAGIPISDRSPMPGCDPGDCHCIEGVAS